MSRADSFIILPRVWERVLVARSATGADYRLSLELVKRARFSPLVKVTDAMAERLKMSRMTKWRVLNRLEVWGLIQMRRMQKSVSPVVRVLYLPPTNVTSVIPPAQTLSLNSEVA
jgi:hypothetical protein